MPLIQLTPAVHYIAFQTYLITGHYHTKSVSRSIIVAVMVFVCVMSLGFQKCYQLFFLPISKFGNVLYKGFADLGYLTSKVTRSCSRIWKKRGEKMYSVEIIQMSNWASPNKWTLFSQQIQLLAQLLVISSHVELEQSHVIHIWIICESYVKHM
jgi:hypothetical protein